MWTVLIIDGIGNWNTQSRTLIKATNALYPLFRCPQTATPVKHPFIRPHPISRLSRSNRRDNLGSISFEFCRLTSSRFLTDPAHPFRITPTYLVLIVIPPGSSHTIACTPFYRSSSKRFLWGRVPRCELGQNFIDPKSKPPKSLSFNWKLASCSSWLSCIYPLSNRPEYPDIRQICVDRCWLIWISLFNY
jgi:hypothetical protein